VYMAWRDSATRLEYLRGSQEFDQGGFTIELRGYQYAVLEDWRELRATAEQPWNELAGALHGQGVYNLDEALSKLRLRPLYEALESALAPEVLWSFIRASKAATAQDVVVDRERSVVEDAATEALLDEAALSGMVLPSLIGADGGFEEGVEGDVVPFLTAISTKTEELLPQHVEATANPLIASFIERAERLLEQEKLLVATVGAAPGGAKASRLMEKANAAIAIPAAASYFKAALPETAKKVLPGIPAGEASDGTDLIWAPILATMLIDNLAAGANLTAGADSAAALFDQLHLRAELADILRTLGVDRESSWRVAARVRILLAHPEIASAAALADEALWSDGDVRWLACLSESQGVTYVNKECFEELLWWLQVPQLLKANGPEDFAGIEEFVETAGAAVVEAGYDLRKLREILAPKAVAVEEEAVEPVADEVEADTVTVED